MLAVGGPTLERRNRGLGRVVLGGELEGHLRGGQIGGRAEDVCMVCVSDALLHGIDTFHTGSMRWR